MQSRSDSWKRRSSAPLILLLAACGDEARISASASLAAPLALEMLEVSVRDGGRLIQWSGSDFQPSPESAFPSTPEVETATGGPDLELTYRLQSAGTVISTGTVVLPRHSDWR